MHQTQDKGVLKGLKSTLTVLVQLAELFPSPQ